MKMNMMGPISIMNNGHVSQCHPPWKASTISWDAIVLKRMNAFVLLCQKKKKKKKKEKRKTYECKIQSEGTYKDIPE